MPSYVRAGIRKCARIRALSLIPGYGKKGMGWLHTKRKLYNTVYKKITFSLFDLFK